MCNGRAAGEGASAIDGARRWHVGGRTAVERRHPRARRRACSLATSRARHQRPHAAVSRPRQAIAAAQGESPPLFDCAAYAKLSRIILSTSTLASDALENGGFGPVNEDCYALGYGIRDYGCRTLVMTYGRDSSGFAAHLEQAMRDMRDAAEKA